MALWDIISSGVKSPSIERECESLIEQGVAAGDNLAYVVRAMIQFANNDTESARDSFYRATQYGAGVPGFVWWLMILVVDSEERFNEVFESFWCACNNGASCIESRQDYSCQISMRANDVAGQMKVYPKEILNQLNESGNLGDVYNKSLPILQIHNIGTRPVINPSIRMCCAKTELDVTVSLADALGENAAPGASTIAPDEIREVDLHFVPVSLWMSGEIYVEVLYQGCKSCMTLETPNGVGDYLAASPFLMWWERGLFGGIVLKIVNLKENPISVQVSKISNGANATETLLVSNLQNDLDAVGVNAISVGWMEFSDSAGLTEGEAFFVSGISQADPNDTYRPIYGQILTSIQQ